MIIQNSNLRRKLFHNRYKILVGVIAIILILLLIPTMNNLLKEQTQENLNQSNQIKNSVSQEIMDSSQTIISGGDVSVEKQTQNTNIIEEFVQACNQKQTEKAYNMLTKDCQEQLYNSDIKEFEKNYINRIFKTQKTYSLQSWINKSTITYQVKIMNDSLILGNTDSEVIEDYYTIIKQNNSQKLNINGYIGQEEIGTQGQNNNIKIRVLSKAMYREYEVYQIEIENNSENIIRLDSKENAKSVYLSSQEEYQFYANLYEVDDSKLVINPNGKKQIEVSFNKRYATTAKIQYMVWTDSILNEEEYQHAVDKKAYSNRTKIVIPI